MSDDVIVRFRADITDLQNDLNKIKGQMSGISNQAEQTAKKTETSIGGAMKSIGPQILAAFSVGALISFGKQVVDITARFQKMEAVLTNTLGSRSEAIKVFKTISDFALRTNFTVEEVTSSFIKLANQGFKPTVRELNKLADVANSTGKTFDQLTEAIIDAQTGEFERLKEFGIIARKEGDKVKFSFKEVTTEVNFTNTAIRDYILSLGDLEGISGSTAAISKTLGAQISFLGDSFDKLLVSIGELGSANGTGLIEDLANVLGGFADRFAIIRKRIDKEVVLLGQTFSVKNYGEVLDEANERNEDLLKLEKSRIDKIRALKKDDAEFNKLSNESIKKTQEDFIKQEQARQQANIKELERLKGLKTFALDIKNQRTVSTDEDIERTIQLIAQNQATIDYLKKEYPNAAQAYVKANKTIKETKTNDINQTKQQIKVEKERLTKIQKEAEEVIKIKKRGATELPTSDAVFDPLGLGTPKTYGVNVESNVKTASSEDVLSSAKDTANGLLDISRQLSDQRIQNLQFEANKELDILQKKLNNKQISEQKYNLEVEKLNKKTSDKIREERLKQFNIDKAAALAQIAINGAQAISKALALSGPLSPFVVGLTTASIATQLALVSSQQPPKFEKGGIIKGKRHTAGGVLIEAEGGEYITPVHTTRKYLPELEAIKNNTFDRLIKHKYILPAMKEQASVLNANLNDSNLLMSDRATRKVLYEIKDALKSNQINNLRFRNV